MDKKIIIGLVLVAIVGAVIFFGQNRAAAPAGGNGKIKATASFYAVYFLARQIGGDKAEVLNITPAGAEPHDYEPSAADMAAIENSRIVFLNGGGLETWGNDVQKTLDPKKTVVIVAGNGLTNLQKDEEGKTITDPHIWLDPELMQKMADAVLAGFVAADPDNRDYYENNASELKSKLATLDEEFRHGLANCAKKEIITSHSAFGYLAARYGLKQVSVAGLSPEEEPSPQQLAQIAEFAKGNNVKYIFFEALVSPKLSETIANEIGAQTLELNPIEGLDADEAAKGDDYITEMQKNLVNLQIALECKK